ncbi:hypothetical protein [Serratia sp. 201]|uniref:hypothetical protein n=1 Tax=Serratia sp. 201 TaxID=3096764 RepID=UPI0030098FE3
MKNFVENQGIKTDKPLPMSYEALKAERDALERQLLISEAKCKGYFSEAATALVKCDALAVENAALKLSRETLAKNALETCNDVFSAGFHSPALHRGLMESTGNRNTYPNPISALVNEAVRELDTPATDAALAAIQAQGVEKAASALDALSAQSASATTQANFRAAAVYLRTTVLPAIGEAK